MTITEFPAPEADALSGGTAPAAPMSRRRKAAIIVRLLLSEGASLPLGNLPEPMQKTLTAEIGAMRYVDGDTLREVVDEFVSELDRVGLTFPGGLEGALSLLDGHISADAAATLRAAATGGRPDPWPRIAAMEAATLLPLVRAEGTEVAAVLLSKLTTAKAAEIISSLPGEQARRIACAVSMTGQVAPETVARIGHTLLDQLEIAPKTAFSEPAAARMGAILNVSPAATRNEVLEGLDAVDTDFAAAVRKAIFTYADIPRRVTARDVPAITRAVAGDVLVTAMAGAEGTDAKATEFILSNMPRRMADQMREQIAERDKVRRGDAEAAMAEIVTVLRALAETGEITLDADEEEDAA